MSKGDWRRPENGSAMRENFDRLDWKNVIEPPYGISAEPMVRVITRTAKMRLTQSQYESFVAQGLIPGEAEVIHESNGA